MEQLPDFTGKVVIVHLLNPPKALIDGCIMEYTSFREYGGQMYLEGRIPQQAGAEWVYHLQTGVRWDQVITYLIFDSIEDYTTRSRTYRPTFWERLKLR